MRTTGRNLYILLFVAILVVVCGCRREALFKKNMPRTQFEAYNTMRYGPQITKQSDPFGLPEPALRARLGQKE
jgi:hypothetical protein|tara:strand:+ start:1902 stop:2120 length:219 start_codon:yes stop_codon:yes gene_type:complete